MNVNTSGNVDGDRAAVSDAGEIPAKAERYIDARSFWGPQLAEASLRDQVFVDFKKKRELKPF